MLGSWFGLAVVPLSMRSEMQLLCCAAHHPCDPPVCLLSLWLVRETLGNLPRGFGGPREHQQGHTLNQKPVIVKLLFRDAQQVPHRCLLRILLSCVYHICSSISASPLQISEVVI